MPYFALLLLTAMGLMLNKVWEGAILGIIVWWLGRKISSPPQDIQQQQLEAMQDELASLRVRVQHLEHGQLQTPTTSAVVLPTLSDDVKPAEVAEPIVSSELSTLISQPTEPMPSAVSASAPSSSSSLRRETLSIRKRLQKQGIEVSPTPPSTAPILDESPTIHHQPSVLSTVIAWLTGGNLLLKTGMVILFLGLAFLLRLATERFEVSIQARYVMVALAGVAATFTGWRLQSRRREYGLMLQGFGIAVLYLTALAALKLHPLLHASVTFGVMVSLVVLMATIAVRQNALLLAQVALVGGMAAPILVSDGSGRYMVLFSYLALLNAGVAGIAWFKAWRSLNWVGFIGTFTIGAIWGARAYTPAHFATTEPFLLYHWLLYTVIACLFARQQLSEWQTTEQVRGIPDDASLSQIWRSVCHSVQRVGILDSALLFGTAFVAFGLQYQMVGSWQYAAAGSAMGFAVVYAGFAWWISRWQADFAVLKQAFVGLAALFVTLAIPLALEQQWTASVWALQAALVYVFAVRQQLPLSRLLALGVFALAAWTQLGTYRAGDDVLLTGSLLGTAWIAGGGAAIYGTWWRGRRLGSAVWESHAQTGVLLATVCFTSFLPMLLWEARGSMLAIALLAAVWAYAQRKHAQWVLSSAVWVSSVCVLWWAIGVYWEDMWREGAHSYVGLLGSALGLGAAAFFLQQNRMPSIALLNRIVGGCVLVIMVLLGMAGVQQGLGMMAVSWQMDLYDKRWLIWTPLGVFAPLAWVASRLAWQQAQRMVWAFLPVFTLLFVVQDWTDAGLVGGAVLIAATALQYYVLSRQTTRANGLFKLHFVSLLLLGLLWTTWSIDWSEAYFTGVWVQLAWLGVPMLIWWGLQTGRERFTGQVYAVAYWRWGSAVAAGYVWLWLLYMNIATPFAPQPLPYLPVLNPLELAMVGVLWQSHRWLMAWSSQEYPERWDGVRHYRWAGLMGLVWITLSAAVMRAWHFLDGVAWDFATLLASFGLQASLSIVWATVAIGLMVTGHQVGQRGRWLMGASLMGVVVVKLFLVELGNSGGIARIVSFIVVGVLLLLVGWFAPVPPKQLADEEGE